MHGDVEATAVGTDLAEQEGRASGVAHGAERIAQIVRQPLAEQIADRGAVDLAFEAQQGGGIGRVAEHLRHADVERQQRAVRLDAAGNVDRFDIAVGEIDGRGG